MSYITKSPWIIHYDGSSCNGCDIEVLACLTPMYDVERFGIINTGNPKHADIFLVTGSVNEQNISVVKQIYDQMPEPKVVVAIGICATSGGIFRECYNIKGGVDTVIPVDVYVPGCAARPEAIIDGVVKGLGVLAEKKKETRSAAVRPIAPMQAEEDTPVTEEAIEVRVYGKNSDEGAEEATDDDVILIRTSGVGTGTGESTAPVWTSAGVDAGAGGGEGAAPAWTDAGANAGESTAPVWTSAGVDAGANAEANAIPSRTDAGMDAEEKGGGSNG